MYCKIRKKIAVTCVHGWRKKNSKNPIYIIMIMPITIEREWILTCKENSKTMVLGYLSKKNTLKNVYALFVSMAKIYCHKKPSFP